LNLAGLPISVYKGALGVVFSYLIPLGVAATVPAGLLAGHPDPVFYVYAPACAVLTGAISQWVWRRAVGSYTSAGG
jgi:ABC-2 type transport system permease protein